MLRRAAVGRVGGMGRTDHFYENPSRALTRARCGLSSGSRFFVDPTPALT